MTKIVHEFPLKITKDQIIKLPFFSEILTVQVRRGKVYLWALVNPSILNEEERHINIYGTGHEIQHDYDLKYISTIQLQNGDLIFHVFEKVNETLAEEFK